MDISSTITPAHQINRPTGPTTGPWDQRITEPPDHRNTGPRAHRITRSPEHWSTAPHTEALARRPRSVSILIRLLGPPRDVVEYAHEDDPSLKLRWRGIVSAIIFLISWKINSLFEPHQMSCKTMNLSVFFRFAQSIRPVFPSLSLSPDVLGIFHQDTELNP